MLRQRTGIVCVVVAAMPAPHFRDGSICWITVGGIGQKREHVDGQTATREYLSLTVSFDHRMIDGAPAARFTERFKELIESGNGLVDQEAASVAIQSNPDPHVVR